MQLRLRVRALSLLVALSLASCVTSHGHVEPTATVAVWGGAMVLGGAVAAAGTCEPDPDHCETVDRASPVVAGALVIGGAALLGLAVLMSESHGSQH